MRDAFSFFYRARGGSVIFRGGVARYRTFLFSRDINRFGLKLIMDTNYSTSNKKRFQILLFEDWFVCGKKLRFVPRRKKNDDIDIRINERIFDKPHIKTVVWGGI